MAEEKKKIKISKSKKILVTFIFLLMILYGINIFVTYGINSYISQKVAKEKELQRPANIEIIELKSSSCTKCFNTLNLINSIKQQSFLKVTKEQSYNDYLSSTAQQLIKKYNIRTIPAIIITGEITKTIIFNGQNTTLATLFVQSGGKSVGEGIVFEGNLPYIDLSDGNIKGLVSLIILNYSACDKCYNVLVHKNILQNGFGIFVDSEVNYDINSTEGKNLINKYNITAVPTILLSPEVSIYPGFSGVWQTVGTVEKDGWYVFRSTDFMIQQGGYFDLEKNTYVK
jgi:hypothetical protein